MEIRNIEINTLKEIKAKVELLLSKIEIIYHQSSDKKLQKWLDGQDVCQLLNISQRTLQTYRDTGKIPYSQINGKIYYKTKDIESILKNKNHNYNR